MDGLSGAVENFSKVGAGGTDGGFDYIDYFTDPNRGGGDPRLTQYSLAETLLQQIIWKQDVQMMEWREHTAEIISEISKLFNDLIQTIKGSIIEIDTGPGTEPFNFEYPDGATIVPESALEVILVEIRYKLGEFVFYLKAFIQQFKTLIVDLTNALTGAARYGVGNQLISGGGAVSPADEAVRLAILNSADNLVNILNVLTTGFRNIGAIGFPDDVTYTPPYQGGDIGGTGGNRIVVDFNIGGNVFSGIFNEDDAMNMVETLQRAQESTL